MPVSSAVIPWTGLLQQSADAREVPPRHIMQNADHLLLKSV